MAENETSVLFLEKESLYFYDSVKISKLDFTPLTVMDFDIVGQEALVNLIFQFIDTNKPRESHYLFVLSESALFIGESVQKDQSLVDLELKNFTALVPYNSVISKKYESGETTKIVATNAELINLILDAFAQKGFSCAVVVPSFIFGQVGIKKGFDMEMALFMVKNQKMAMNKSLTAPHVIEPVNVFKVTKGKSTMLPMLLGVFGAMVVALILLLVLRK